MVEDFVRAQCRCLWAGNPFKPLPRKRQTQPLTDFRIAW